MLGHRVQELETNLSAFSLSTQDLSPSERRAMLEEAKVLRDQIDECRIELGRNKRNILQLREEAVRDATMPEAILNGTAEEADKWATDQIPDTAGSRLLRQLVDLHADWEMRCGRTSDFQQAILSSGSS